MDTLKFYASLAFVLCIVIDHCQSCIIVDCCWIHKPTIVCSRLDECLDKVPLGTPQQAQQEPNAARPGQENPSNRVLALADADRAMLDWKEADSKVEKAKQSFDKLLKQCLGLCQKLKDKQATKDDLYGGLNLGLQQVHFGLEPAHVTLSSHTV